MPMSDKHVGCLRENIRQLGRFIDARSGLVEELVGNGTLTHSDRERVYSKVTETDTATEVISILTRKPDHAFDVFICALHRTQHGHVIHILTGNGDEVPMSDVVLARLDNLADTLIGVIETEYGLRSKMIANGSITAVDDERIRARKTRSEKVEELLKILKRKPQSSFVKFVRALAESTQQHVARLVMGVNVTGILKLETDKAVGERERELIENELRQILESHEELAHLLVSNGIHASFGRGSIMIVFTCYEVESLCALRSILATAVGSFYELVERCASQFANRGLKNVGIQFSQQEMDSAEKELTESMLMTQEHRRDLQFVAETLADKILIEDSFLRRLALCRLIQEAVRETPTAVDRSRLLFDFVSRRPDSEFEQLIEALKTSGQEFIAECLINGEDGRTETPSMQMDNWTSDSYNTEERLTQYTPNQNNLKELLEVPLESLAARWQSVARWISATPNAFENYAGVCRQIIRSFTECETGLNILEETFLEEFKLPEPTRVNVAAIHVAAYHGNADIISVLCEVGAAVNFTSERFGNNPDRDLTPLHWAALNGKTGTVKVLLEHGADVNISTAKGMTAADLAIMNEHFEESAMLLTCGAKCSECSLEFMRPRHRTREKQQESEYRFDDDESKIRDCQKYYGQLSKGIFGGRSVGVIRVASMAAVSSRIRSVATFLLRTNNVMHIRFIVTYIVIYCYLILITWLIQCFINRRSDIYKPISISLYVSPVASMTEWVTQLRREYAYNNMENAKQMSKGTSYGGERNTLVSSLHHNLTILLTRKKNWMPIIVSFVLAVLHFIVLMSLLPNNTPRKFVTGFRGSHLLSSVGVVRVASMAQSATHLSTQYIHNEIEMANAQLSFNYSEALLVMPDKENYIPNIANTNDAVFKSVNIQQVMMDILEACRYVAPATEIPTSNLTVTNDVLPKSGSSHSSVIDFHLFHNATQRKYHEVKSLLLNGANVNFVVPITFVTPLHIASANGDLEMVKLLLDFGAEVNATTANRGTAVMISSYAGNAVITKLLIEKGADVNARDEQLMTPLHHAVLSGSPETVNVLLSSNVNLNAKTVDSLTPLHMAVAKGFQMMTASLLQKGADVNTANIFAATPLYSSVAKGHAGIVNMLIKAGAEINQSCGPAGTPLHVATLKKDSEIVRVLVKNGANMYSLAVGGLSPLHFACLLGFANIVKQMLAENVDVNVLSKTGFSPLQLAVIFDHEAVAQLLVENGALLNNVATDGNTALCTAVANQATDSLQVLLDHGADVNGPCVLGCTPLAVALLRDFQNVTRLLLNRKADVNASCADGMTPLLVAIVKGSAEMVDLLLDHGADPNFNISEGGLSYLHTATVRNQPNIVRMLVAKRGNVNVKCSTHGQTPLQLAAMFNKSDILQILIENGADMNAAFPGGLAPIHAAAMLGFTRIADALLSAGVDVNSRTAQGLTPLLHAVFHKHPEMARLLLDYRADIDAMDENGTTPLVVAITRSARIVRLLLERNASVNGRTPLGMTPLHMAVLSGHTRILRMMLDGGPNISAATEDGLTALHLAAAIGTHKAAKMLIDKQADANARDIHGNTALHTTVACDHLKTAELLLQRGADVNAVDVNGSTALHSAVINGSLEMVEMLINEGADVNVVNVHGLSPLHSAVVIESLAKVRVLLKADADADVRGLNEITPLHMAGYNGAVDIATLLIENGAKLSHPGCDVTPLQIAVYCGHYDVVKLMLSKGSDVNHWSCDGFASLHMAAERGRSTIVELLIHNGADVNAGCTKCGTPLFTAVCGDHRGTAKLLIDHGARVTARCTNETCSSVWVSASNSFLGMLEPFDNEKVNSSSCCCSGEKPLHPATDNGNVPMVKMLLDTGHYRHQPADGVLLIAVRNGNADIVKMFLEMNMDLSIGFGEVIASTVVAVVRGHWRVLKLLLDCYVFHVCLVVVMIMVIWFCIARILAFAIVFLSGMNTDIIIILLRKVERQFKEDNGRNKHHKYKNVNTSSHSIYSH